MFPNRFNSTSFRQLLHFTMVEENFEYWSSKSYKINSILPHSDNYFTSPWCTDCFRSVVHNHLGPLHSNCLLLLVLVLTFHVIYYGLFLFLYSSHNIWRAWRNFWNDVNKRFMPYIHTSFYSSNLGFLWPGSESSILSSIIVRPVHYNSKSDVSHGGRKEKTYKREIQLHTEIQHPRSANKRFSTIISRNGTIWEDENMFQ